MKVCTERINLSEKQKELSNMKAEIQINLLWDNINLLFTYCKDLKDNYRNITNFTKHTDEDLRIVMQEKKKLEADVKRLETRFDDFYGKTFESSTEKLRSQISNVSTKLEAACEKFKLLEEECNARGANHLKEEVTRIDQEINKLASKTAVEDIRKRINDVDSSLIEYQLSRIPLNEAAITKHTNHRFEMLNTELVSLKDHISKYKTEIEHWRNKNRMLEKEVEELKFTNDKLSKDLCKINELNVNVVGTKMDIAVITHNNKLLNERVKAVEEMKHEIPNIEELKKPYVKMEVEEKKTVSDYIEKSCSDCEDTKTKKKVNLEIKKESKSVRKSAITSKKAYGKNIDEFSDSNAANYYSLSTEGDKIVIKKIPLSDYDEDILLSKYKIILDYADKNDIRTYTLHAELDYDLEKRLDRFVDRASSSENIDIKYIKKLLKQKEWVYTLTYDEEQLAFKQIPNHPLRLKNKYVLYVWLERQQAYLYIPYGSYLDAVKQHEEKLKKEAEAKKKEKAEQLKQKKFNYKSFRPNYNNGYSQSFRNDYYNPYNEDSCYWPNGKLNNVLNSFNNLMDIMDMGFNELKRNQRRAQLPDQE
jgi:uncharacterized coiled-coil protein SlyX